MYDFENGALASAIAAFFDACIANSEIKAPMRYDVEALGLSEISRLSYSGFSEQDAVYFSNEARSFAVRLDILRMDQSIGGYGVLVPDTPENAAELRSFTSSLPNVRDITADAQEFLAIAPAEMRPFLAKGQYWEFDLTPDLGLPEMIYKETERIGLAQSPAQLFGDRDALEMLSV